MGKITIDVMGIQAVEDGDFIFVPVVMDGNEIELLLECDSIRLRTGNPNWSDRECRTWVMNNTDAATKRMLDWMNETQKFDPQTLRIKI